MNQIFIRNLKKANSNSSQVLYEQFSNNSNGNGYKKSNSIINLKNILLIFVIQFCLILHLHGQPFEGTLIDTFIISPSLQSSCKLFPGNGSQHILIYLPPSYYKNINKSYPVIYFLTGYREFVNAYSTNISWSGGYSINHSTDKLITNGTTREVIMVVAQGEYDLGGSFYVNSETSGNWEDFIVKDLVGYMDKNFRTIDTCCGRAISGLSMGGFGALNLSMKHPDIFSVGYGISSGLINDAGLQEMYMFNSETAINKFLDNQAKIRGMSKHEAHNKLLNIAQGYKNQNNEDDLFAYSYGAAFSADSGQGAPYFKYPFFRSGDKLVTDSAVLKRWRSGFGDLKEKVVLYKENLLKLKGYFLDYGINDQYTWIPKGNKYLSEILTENKIQHTVLQHDGSHYLEIKSRIESFLMPYCNSLLLFDTVNLSDEALIYDVSCKLKIINKKVDNDKKEITFYVNENADISQMNLNFSLSVGATVTPGTSEKIDFTKGAVPHVVKAENRVNTSNYKINVIKTKSINLALFKEVEVSSTDYPENEKEFITDGDLSTRWSSSYHDNEWLEVDLGKNLKFNKVIINWEAAYGKDYDIWISDDKLTWTTVFSRKNGKGGTDSILFSDQNARYIKLEGKDRGTSWGYSIYEFEAYYDENIHILPTKIDETEIENKIAIYPNPTEGLVNLELSNSISGPFKLEVFDIARKRIDTFNFTVFSRHIIVNLSKYENSVFLLRLSDNKRNVYKKILVKK